MTDGDYRIIIEDCGDFDAAQILECGQTFRYRKADGGYTVYARDKRCFVAQGEGGAQIVCSPQDDAFWRDYFDLQTDYGAIKRRLSALPDMSRSIPFGKGIRILRQDHWEALIGFIVSANNNLPRIKGIVARLCEVLGEDMGGWRAFPTPRAMAQKDAAFYRDLGAGYRAAYLADAARAVDGGFDLGALERCDSDTARKALRALPGVGPKVADCVLLYGYHKTDVFPVDTWIKKAYALVCQDGCANVETMRARLKAIYGDDGGYAQQYLFYRLREKG